MATQVGFEPNRFNPERTGLPALETGKSLDKATTDIVVGLAGDDAKLTLSGASSDLDRDAARAGATNLLTALQAQGATSKANAVTTLTLGGLRVVAVGLGADVDVSTEQLRRAAGAAARFVVDNSGALARRVAFNLDLASQSQVRAVAEGALLGGHRFAKLTASAKPASRIERVQILTSVRGADRAITAARAVAGAVLVARDWADVPANLLAPADFVDQARGYLKDVKVELEVLDEKALERAGFGGILAVGAGSMRPPRLLRLSYRPRGAKQHLALVGKGITFDSGGYSIKPTESMVSMKTDMAGAADVVAATHAIAERGLNVQVTTYAALAESMISGAAYRPGDVLTMFDGTTVENRNSDAEGRIVLADALARASQDGPDLIVDIATLTGACVVALGTQVAGLFASTDDVADQLLDACDAAGESFWQLPITEQARSELASHVADLRSTARRQGALVFSAAFLEHFVADGIGWAHLDVAGPAWNMDPAHDYVCQDSTGMGVRTLVQLAERMAG